jgi:hypothetical protein
MDVKPAGRAGDGLDDISWLPDNEELDDSVDNSPEVDEEAMGSPESKADSDVELIDRFPNDETSASVRPICQF